MNKYGVETFPPEQEDPISLRRKKVAVDITTCPRCQSPLEPEEPNPSKRNHNLSCPRCGTEPFERK